MDRKTKLNIIIVFIIIIILTKIYNNKENFTTLEKIGVITGEQGNTGIAGEKGGKGDLGDMGKANTINDNNLKIKNSLTLGKNGKIYNNINQNYQLKLSKKIKRGGTKLKINKDGITHSNIQNYISLNDEMKINKKGIYLKGNFKTIGGYVKMKLNNELRLFDRVPKHTIWPWHFENGDPRVITSGFYYIKQANNYLDINSNSNNHDSLITISQQNTQQDTQQYFYIKNNGDQTYTILALRFPNSNNCHTDYDPYSSNCNDRYIKIWGGSASNSVTLDENSEDRFNFLVSNNNNEFKIVNLSGSVPKYLNLENQNINYDIAFSRASIFTIEPRIPPGWVEYDLGNKSIIGTSLDFPSNSSGTNSEVLTFVQDNLPRHSHEVSSAGSHSHEESDIATNNNHFHQSFNVINMRYADDMSSINMDTPNLVSRGGFLPTTTSSVTSPPTAGPNIADYRRSQSMALSSSGAHTHRVRSVEIPSNPNNAGTTSSPGQSATIDSSGNHSHNIIQTNFENCRHEHSGSSSANTCLSSSQSNISPINFKLPVLRLKYIKKL